MRISDACATHQEFVVDSFDDDFLGFVLADVESQLQVLLVSLLRGQTSELYTGTAPFMQPENVVQIRSQLTLI